MYAFLLMKRAVNGVKERQIKDVQVLERYV